MRARDNSAAPHLNGRCRSSAARLSAVMAKGEVGEVLLAPQRKRGTVNRVIPRFYDMEGTYIL